MNSQIFLNDLVILFGGFLSLLLAIAFLIKKSQSGPSNYFLVLLLLDVFLSLYLKFFDKADYFKFYPHLLRVNYVLNLLRPALFYLYFYFIARPSVKIRPVHFLHFSPVVFLIAYMTPYFVLSAEEKLSILNGSSSPVDIPSWYRFGGLLYSLAYLILAWLQMKRISDTKESDRRDSGRQQMRLIIWMKLMLLGYCFFMFLAIANWFFDYQYQMDYYLYQSISLMVMIICVRLMSIPEMGQPIKYERSTLSEEDKLRYLSLLEEAMTKREIYKMSKLRLKELAKELKMQEHHLSQLINEKHKLSFNDFINQKRIERSKELLLDPKYKHLTIEGIGYEVGFSSKAAFFTAFKQFTNTTPKAFKTV